MNRKRLFELYNQSAPTWEGLSLEGLDSQLKEIDAGVEYEVCKGKEMNDICKLTGNNAYPDNLTIVILTKWSIPMLDWKIKYGCRWLDDVIANNVDREGKTTKSIFRGL